MVDRLLASPHYGERWAQHWLDLVRYAETDGFKADDLRPEAYRYRDYVIRAFNADLPYDRFVRQQLAGDELEPDNPDALIATGFNRLWPDEYNAANLEQRRQEILDDVTDTAGLVFLGLTFGCARCHDHKFDPIPQTDYYRLQAFFAPMRPRDDVPALDGAARKDYQVRLAAWEAATKDIRAEMDALVADKREEARKHALTKFRDEIQQAERTPEDKRTPYQRLIALMAEKQMDRAAKDAAAKLPDDKKKRYQELEQKLAAVEPRRPERPPLAMSVSDVGREAPPTFRLQGGDWRKPKEEVKAGFPAFLGGGDATPAPPAGEADDRPAFRAGALADAEGQSADGPRHGQSPLAAPFRRRHRRHAERLRRHGRAGHAPRIARLAGRRVRGERLEPQAHAPADGAVGGLLPGFRDRPERRPLRQGVGRGPRRPSALARPPAAAGGRGDPRRHAGRRGELNPRMFGVERPAETAGAHQQLRLEAGRQAGGPEPPVDLRLRQTESALSAVRRLRPAGHAQQLRPPGRHHDGAAGAAAAQRRLRPGARRADLAPTWRRNLPLRRRGLWRRGPTGPPGADRPRPTR